MFQPPNRSQYPKYDFYPNLENTSNIAGIIIKLNDNNNSNNILIIIIIVIIPKIHPFLEDISKIWGKNHTSTNIRYKI